eukprot:12647531-Heterocapsa_arctica.AAC.1
MNKIPLNSPLLVAISRPVSGHVPKHAIELPLRMMCDLLALASGPDGPQSLAASLILLCVTSSLRFQHAQRA